MFTAQGQDYDAALKRGDFAMYHVKESGRNNYMFLRDT